MMFYAIKTYIETGKIDKFEEYKEKFIREKEVELEQIPSEWRKAPEQTDGTEIEF